MYGVEQTEDWCVNFRSLSSTFPHKYCNNIISKEEGEGRGGQK